MAETIRGINVVIGADTTGLSKALGDVNKKSRDIQSELKQVDRLLKLDPSNTQLIAQKQKLLADAVANTTEKLNRLKNTQQQVNDQFERGEISEGQYRAFQREVAKTEQELKKLQGQLKDTGHDFDKLGESLDKAGQKMSDAGKQLSMRVTAPIVALGGIALKAGIDFEAAMSEVAAISGATGDQLGSLTEKAKEMGSTTKFSASESAAALKYMAMAGWDTEQMLDGLEGVMSLAAASGEDLATVSDIVTDSMTAFGLAADQAGQFADILATASSKSNTNVSMLGESFKYVAPVAGALGYSAEDTAVALGLMANAGIKASQSGTSLRSALTNMAKPSKEMRKVIDALNLSITDNDGQMKSLGVIMDDLRGAFGGLTKDQQAAYAATLFGKEAMSGMLAIINTSTEDYNNLTDSINGSAGAAKEMADIMGDNAKGSLTELMSALEGLAIQVSEILMPVFKGIIDDLKSFVGWLSNLSPNVQKTIIVIAGLAAALGPVLIILGQVTSAVGTLMPVLGALTGPVGIVVAAIAGLVAGLVHLYKNNETVMNALNNAWEWIKDTAMSIFSEIRKFWDKWGDDILSSFKNTWDTVKKAFDVAVKEISKVVRFVFDGLQQFWDKWGTTITDMFKNVFEIVKILFGAAFDVISTTAKLVFNALQKFWEVWGGTIKVVFKTILNVVKSIFEGVWNAIKVIIETVIGVISNVIKGFLSVLKGDWKGAWDAIEGIVVSVWEGIKGIFSTIGKTMYNVGKDIIVGLIDGIKSMAGAAVTAAKNIANEIGGSVKDFFKIKSPSRLMMGYGKDIGEGLAIGIKDSVSDVKQQVSVLNSAASDVNAGFSTSGQTSSSAQTGAYNFDGMFSGAVFNVRSDNDIKSIATELYNMQRSAMRGVGAT